ncbi:MAG: hypothetical protein IJ279_04225 [Clostridia bacterium]|nr:hypothetical protein [Clostridia bacterium]
MTFKELYQYKDLKAEIVEEENRLAELRERLYALQSPSLGVGGSSSGVANHKEMLVNRILDIEKIIRERKIRCEEERLKIEKFIASIEDSYTRQIFTYRFVEHYSWNKVAMKVSGGTSTGDCVRMICIRFLQNH